MNRDPGRFRTTKDKADLGKFRTPPLRYTLPYMHNGVFYTFEEVVDFYDQGGGEDPIGTKSDKLQPLGLSDGEKTDLVAFLESLSGTEVLTQRPELPLRGLLDFPMVNQW